MERIRIDHERGEDRVDAIKRVLLATTKRVDSLNIDLAMYSAELSGFKERHQVLEEKFNWIVSLIGRELGRLETKIEALESNSQPQEIYQPPASPFGGKTGFAALNYALPCEFDFTQGGQVDE
jgi:hypothetical protein